MGKSKVSEEAIRKAFEVITKTLEPLNDEERRRVVGASVVFYEIDIKSKRTHEGDHECA